MEVVIQKYVRFLLFISLCFSCLENSFCYSTEGHDDNSNTRTFSVLAFGAKGDGVTNDAKAFKRTWDAACKTREGVVLIPPKRSFLVQPLKFDGSKCQPNVVVQVNGRILAPNKKDWANIDEYWLLFEGLDHGIQIRGDGIIDGRGASWWGQKNSRPHALGISKSANVVVTGIRIVNSPMMHIYIANSHHVKITGLTINSPGKSPNTDGIHLSNVQHANVISSNIACGDDCISIQTGCSDVKIYDVHCGPGHGYSIGGLAPKGGTAHVSDITVLKSTVRDAENGVRIKTWPGGSGLVHGVIFSGITMSNVNYPIIIDQNYCGGHHQKCPINNKKAVAINNVSFTDIQGTYLHSPVSLVCSQFVPCNDLTISNIDITPAPSNKNKPVAPTCVDAHGRLSGQIIPSLKTCL